MPTLSHPAAPPALTYRALPWAWLGLLAVTLLWDAFGLDLPLMQLIGSAQGFVLRGDAPSGELKPIFETPIRESTYRDTSVKPGVRYVYAVVAVDTAMNVGMESNRVEETAR